MSNINLVDLNQNHDFMQPIYQKVAKLKQNLHQYEYHVSGNQNSQENYKNSPKDKNLLNSNQNKPNNQLAKKFVISNPTNTKVNCLTINNQFKLNRQNLIYEQRTKTSSFNRFPSQQNLNFLSTKSNLRKSHSIFYPNKQQNNNFHPTLRKLSVNNDLSKKTKQFYQNTLTKDEPKRLKKFSSLPFMSSIQTVKCQKPTKKQFQKGKTQRKISRLVKFLDKNLNNQKPKHQKIYDNPDHNQNKVQQTGQNLNKDSYMKTIDDYDSFANEYEFSKLKQEQKKLQEQKTFKPIGSAKFTNKNRTMEQKQQIPTKQKPEQNLNKIMLIKSNLSNYSNQNDKKIKYLQKGNQIRTILQKKLSKNKNKSNENNQLIYLHDFDQWVPTKMVEKNRHQLQKYLTVLLGQRKETKYQKVNLQDVDIVYI